MQHILLTNLVHFSYQSTDDTIFTITPGKSTFIHIAEKEDFQLGKDPIWASPTALCGHSSDQYHPCFVMAILSVLKGYPYSSQIESFSEIKIPGVDFKTSHNVRRSMTLNAMRMSTELFTDGSERVYQLAKQRLEANQPDVVHDLLVYLMHAILDARRAYAQEVQLRAESLAAYLGLLPPKVLLLMQQYTDDESRLSELLQQGDAGPLQRQLNIDALVENQMGLLAPYRQDALKREELVKTMIDRVLVVWQNHN